MRPIIGTTPSASSFIVAAGEPQGEHQGYVAHDAVARVSYAGVGVLTRDAIHFAPDAWDMTPRTSLEAFREAKEMARLEGWVASVLIDEADPAKE